MCRIELGRAARPVRVPDTCKRIPEVDRRLAERTLDIDIDAGDRGIRGTTTTPGRGWGARSGPLRPCNGLITSRLIGAERGDRRRGPAQAVLAALAAALPGVSGATAALRVP